MKELWFKNAEGRPIKDTEEISAEQVDSSRFPADQPAVDLPNRVTPAVPLSESLSLGAVSGEEYFTDEPVVADFNFNGANLTQIIPVFAQLLGFSYVLEGAVSGTATISMHDTITQKEL